MARDLESLVVSLSADIKRFESELRRANGVTDRQARAIEARWRQANKNLDGIGRSMAQSIVAPLAGIGAALGAREIMSYADAWTRAGNLIAAAGQVAGRSGRSLEGVNQIANDTRGGFAETAELYARLLRSTAGVATSEKEVAQATETVNKAFKAGGAAASEMAAGVLQLSQGLGSGVLAGDELRSVRENAPLLAQAIADYFGTTVAGLKKLGEEGKLTSEKVFKAILAAKGKIDGAFNATAQTIGDAVTKVNNAFTQYIGQSDESLGAADRLKAALNALADNFDNVADVTIKVAGIIAGALVGRSIVGMIAKLGLATQAVTTFVAALRTASIATAIGGLSAAAGPLGLLIGGTVAGALALYYSNTKDATAGSKEYAAALKQVEAAAQKTGPAVENAAKSAAKASEEAYAGAAARAKQAMADMANDAIRQIDSALEIHGRANPAADEQLRQVRQLYEEYKNGKARADDLKRALDDLARGQAPAYFIQLAQALGQVIPKLEQASDVARTVNLAKIQKDFEPFNAEANYEDTQRKIAKAAKEYYDNAVRLNGLTKEQLRLEEEIAKVKKDASSKGVQLTDARAKEIAQINIAGNDRRSAEGRPIRRDAAARFDQDIQSVRDRTAALIEEQRIIGLSVQEQESRRMAMDLEQQALRNLREEARRKGETDLESIQLSQQQKDEIAQVSAAYGQQAAALERVREAHQRAEQLASEFYDTFKSGIVDAITGAKSLDEALQGVLKRLGELLINAAFDSLLKPPGSGAGGIIGSLLGLGGGGGGLPSIGNGHGLYSEGGYTGPGGKYQPAGVVHAGEVVWSQKDVARAGGVAAVEAMRLGRRGYADGGPVLPQFTAPTLPRMTSAARGVTVNGGSTSIVVQGNADETTLAAMRRELAKRDAEFESRTIATVRRAGRGRML